jgi:hypothetical protein
MDIVSQTRQLSLAAAMLPDIEKAKFWIVECCPFVGAYSGTLEPYEFIGRYADAIEKATASDLFFERQKEHIGHAMRMIANSRFTDPASAVASVYLVTRLEFFFRILSGVLKFDGTWKDERLRTQYKKEFLPGIKLGKRINDVAVTYKIATIDKSNSRTSHLRDLDNRIAGKLKSAHPDAVYSDIGDRIALLR